MKNLFIKILTVLMSLSLTTGSSLNVYASYSDEDTLNDEVFSDGNSTISNEYDNPKLFDSELDSQDNFTDQMQNTEILPEVAEDTFGINADAQAIMVQINNKVQQLLVNTSNSEYPLLEYEDPVNITADFSQSAEGVVQAFFHQYGDLSSKNRVWRMKYEEVLVDLLSDESFLKRYKDARRGELEDFTYSILGEIADESTGILSSFTGNAIKIERASLQNRLKNTLVDDTEKIYILALLEDNTTDENLRQACKNCMSHYFSASMDSIGDALIDIAVLLGTKKAETVEVVKNQILSQTLKKTYLTKMIQKLSLGTVASTVSEILLIKDALSFLTGIDARVDTYLKTVCLDCIYEASAASYGKSVDGAKYETNEDVKILYTMFNFALQVKQEAYKSMSSIYTSSIWKKIIKTDPYLKSNSLTIKNITIDNYRKTQLGKLTPICTVSDITVNLDDKITYPLSDISYLATIGYASKDKKIVSINQSGVMKGKKEGTTYVGCVVDQYGETYNLICKVTVVAPKISLNKSSTTITVHSTTTLKATVSGTSSKVTWFSSNTKVAKVNNNGKITGVKPGTAVITAYANGIKCYCKIKVNDYTKDVSKVLNLSFNQARKKLGMRKMSYDGYSTQYSLTGEKNSSYISNVCLPEYEDIPGVLVLRISDKYYSCSGAKIGMSRPEIIRKLTAGGWRNESRPGSKGSIFRFGNSLWNIIVSYKNNRATCFLIDRDE